MPLTRRAVLRGALAGTIGACAGATSYGIAYERHRVGLTEAALAVSGLPHALDGLRVALITDVHHSHLVPAADVSEAVSLALGARPDLIVLGGDYVTYGDRDYVEPVAELLSPLTAPHGVYAILGNHDDDRDMPAALARRHFTVLKDQRTILEIRGEWLELAGIRFWTRRVSDVARVLKGARAPVLLLAHDPRRITEAASLDVPAVLSGHTHGGQFFPWTLAVRLVHAPHVAGLSREGLMWVYVSAGTGTWGPPVRFGTSPEITLVKLTRVGRS
jgi:predicted MPP superfamily phosphohydrolase